MSGSKIAGTIRHYAGRADMLVGVMSLALAMVLANLYCRKRGASRDLAFITRTTGVLIAGPVTMLFLPRPRKVS